MSEYSRIFDGWLTRYKVNRPLNKYELTYRLKALDAISLPPVDKGAVKMNGGFIEYVDRYFFWRGWAAMGFLMVGGVVIFYIVVWTYNIYSTYRESYCFTRAYSFWLVCNFIAWPRIRVSVHLCIKKRFLLLHPLPNPFQSEKSQGLYLST